MFPIIVYITSSFIHSKFIFFFLLFITLLFFLVFLVFFILPFFISYLLSYPIFLFITFFWFYYPLLFLYLTFHYLLLSSIFYFSWLFFSKVEALDLFEDICNNTVFVKSSLILFLNKRDLFEEKIKSKNIRDYFSFSDYSGADCDYDAGTYLLL